MKCTLELLLFISYITAITSFTYKSRRTVLYRSSKHHISSYIRPSNEMNILVDTSTSSPESISSNDEYDDIDEIDHILSSSQEASDTMISSTIDTSSSNGIILQDRNKYQKRRSKKYKRYADRLKPCNINMSSLLYHDTSLEYDDVIRISQQLGYVPYNLIKIGAYDHIDIKRPIVAVLYPLNADKYGGRYDESDGLKPFPTIYWLSCPIMHARISQLEKIGWITIIETKLKANEYRNSFADAMRNSHDLYRQARLELLNDAHIEYIEMNGWTRPLLNAGIAGIRNYSTAGVKCLHTHYSHYRARPDHRNLVGKWVHELLMNDITSIDEATAALTYDTIMNN